jgi:hypothetical protein
MVGRTALQVPDSRTKWAEIEQTILVTADDGDKIVCLDSNKVVLRAFTYDGEKTEGGERPAADGASTELVLLGRELNAAADNAAKRHENAYTLAFTKMADLCTAVMDRLGTMEIAAHDARIAEAKARAEMIVAVAQAKAADGGSMDPLLAQMLGIVGPGVMAALSSGTAAPNGKG